MFNFIEDLGCDMFFSVFDVFCGFDRFVVLLVLLFFVIFMVGLGWVGLSWVGVFYLVVDVGGWLLEL